MSAGSSLASSSSPSEFLLLMRASLLAEPSSLQGQARLCRAGGVGRVAAAAVFVFVFDLVGVVVAVVVVDVVVARVRRWSSSNCSGGFGLFRRRRHRRRSRSSARRGREAGSRRIRRCASSSSSSPFCAPLDSLGLGRDGGLRPRLRRCRRRRTRSFRGGAGRAALGVEADKVDRVVALPLPVGRERGAPAGGVEAAVLFFV